MFTYLIRSPSDSTRRDAATGGDRFRFSQSRPQPGVSSEGRVSSSNHVALRWHRDHKDYQYGRATSTSTQLLRPGEK